KQIGSFCLFHILALTRTPTSCRPVVLTYIGVLVHCSSQSEFRKRDMSNVFTSSKKDRPRCPREDCLAPPSRRDKEL
ncbi:hypothetical protein LSAT2_025544, partial [Lamellibrachia satsuma]